VAARNRDRLKFHPTSSSVIGSPFRYVVRPQPIAVPYLRDTAYCPGPKRAFPLDPTRRRTGASCAATAGAAENQRRRPGVTFKVFACQKLKFSTHRWFKNFSFLHTSDSGILRSISCC